MASIVDADYPGAFHDAGSVGSPVNTNTVTPSGGGGNTYTGEGVTLVLAIAAYGGTASTPFQIQSVTDPANNQWNYSTAQQSNSNTPVWGAAGNQGANNYYSLAAIAYCIGAKPVQSVTAALTAACFDFRATLYEYDQVPFGASVTGAAAAAPAGLATGLTTPSITAQSGDFIVAVSTPDLGWGGANAPFTYDSVWNDLVSAYEVGASAGAASCTWTSTGSQFAYGSCILAIRGTGASPLKPGLNRIWPSQNTPSSGRHTTGSAVGVQGTEFSVSQTCWMTAFWWFAPAGSGGLTPSPELGLYTVSNQTLVTGTHVTGATWNGAAQSPGAWIRQPLAAPVQLSPSVNYMAVAVVNNNWPNTGSFTFPLTSGILTASQSGVLANSGTLAFPTSADTSTAYYVDAEVSLTNPALSSSGLLMAGFP